MKVSKRQLKRIIQEEKWKLLEAGRFGPHGPGGSATPSGIGYDTVYNETLNILDRATDLGEAVDAIQDAIEMFTRNT